MKAFAISIELLARMALYMTVMTLSLKHMLKDRKAVEPPAGEDRRG